MQVHASAEKMGIIVMKNADQIDPRATESIREHREIQRAALVAALAFRPILTINLAAPGRTEDLRIAPLFKYMKDGQLLWRWAEPDQFRTSATYAPSQLLNLEPYREGNVMVGMWEVSTSLTVFTKQQLLAVPKGQKRDFILGRRVGGVALSYLELASYKWEVVLHAPDALDASGMRVRPIRQTTYTDQTFRVDEI